MKILKKLIILGVVVCFLLIANAFPTHAADEYPDPIGGKSVVYNK